MKQFLRIFSFFFFFEIDGKLFPRERRKETENIVVVRNQSDSNETTSRFHEFVRVTEVGEVKASFDVPTNLEFSRTWFSGRGGGKRGGGVVSGRSFF